MTVNKLTSPISQNDLINKTNEIIDNLGGGGANTDLSNLTATGEAHFQEPLVSGTNIKTINNTSILGSGNVDTSETFTIIYNVTTYQEIQDNIENKAILFKSSASSSICYPAIAFSVSSGYQIRVFSGQYYTIYAVSSSGWTTGTQYDYQYTSTAVTHTANTAVGNSTTPVYIASNGTATSTGLSIASSRFDGTITYKYSSHSPTTSTGSKTISLSSYLPNDTYSYNVLVSGYINNNNSTISVVKIKGSSSMTNSAEFLRAGQNGRYQQNTIWLPVDTSRTITLTVENGAISNTFTFELYAYRRIGTNS